MTRDRADLSRLAPASEIDGIVGDFVAILAARQGFGAHRAVWAAGRRATAALLGAWADRISELEALIVVADVVCARLPFGCLATGPDVPPSSPEELRFLGPDEGVVVCHLPSASLYGPLATRSDAGRRDGDGSIMILEGSDPRLPGARIEADLLAEVFSRAAILRDRCARPPAPFRVLHVAAHATRCPEDGWSRIELPGSSLDPASVLELPAAPRLAKLSACRTADGHPVEGEGTLGFARSFLALGTRDVIVSAWPIPDADAARFNASFYAALAGGASVSEAFTRAQQVLRRSSERNPTAWGAFLRVGVP